MKYRNIVQTGTVLFLIGIILIFISWINSYPIKLSNISEITFYQFSILIWPGIIFSLFGLFLIGFFNKNKFIQVICSSIFTLLLYITVYYYSYISSSDSGGSRASFYVFHNIGINPETIAYFEFPNFFCLNEIIHQILKLNEQGIAIISFTIFGILLTFFLYLIFYKLNDKIYFILPFLMVIIYFIGGFNFLNYQWVPQTLALVYFFLLLLITTYFLSDFNYKIVEWKIIIILVFISLVFSHAFIPTFFLLFFGIFTLKKRYFIQIFFITLSIYLIYTIYYSTYHFAIYIEAFQQSVQGIGGEYTSFLSKSTTNTEEPINQFISLFNRIRVLLVWIISSTGLFILFLKKKIKFFFIALGLAGGIYIIVGIFYSVLGLRAIQILFIPMTIGFIYFFFKWKKIMIIIIMIIIIISVFGPMRMAYNQTQFQLDEEANICNFLADNIPNNINIKVSVNQVNYGFFTVKYKYLRNKTRDILRPENLEFFNIFNISMKKNEFVVYNTNLGKEIVNYKIRRNQLNGFLKNKVKLNNKIYECGKTYILNGISK